MFAPVDSALSGLTRRRLQSNDLYSIVATHIVASVVPTSSIPEGVSMLQSLSGTNLRVRRTGARIHVNGVFVQVANILASNGIVHGLGRSLVGIRTKPKPSPKDMMGKGKGSYVVKSMSMSSSSTGSKKSMAKKGQPLPLRQKQPRNQPGPRPPPKKRPSRYPPRDIFRPRPRGKM